MAAGLPVEGENSQRPRAADVARKDVPVFALNDNLGDVRRRVREAGWVPIKEMADYTVKHKLESSPVTTSDGMLIGLLFRSDALQQAEGCPDCERKLI